MASWLYRHLFRHCFTIFTCSFVWTQRQKRTQSGGSNLSKEALLSRVWGFDSNAVENSVEVYVGFLRKKLASIGSNVRIESVRRLGYHLEVASSC